MKTKVSIIVPAKNEEKFIHESLSYLVTQQYKNIEIIVIDDQSTDNTRKIIESFRDARIKIINGPGKGFATAWNTGFTECQGEVITQCDADDRYPKDRLIKQVTWLAAHPEFDAVCGAYWAMDQKGNTISRLASYDTESEISEELKNGVTRTSLCTFAIRAHALKKVGGLRNYFPTSGDIDLQLRFGETHRVYYLPDFTYYYRIHDASVTHSQPAHAREFYENTARLFQKQRQTRGYDDLQVNAAPSPPEIHGKENSAERHIQALLTGEAWRMHEEGKTIDALKTGFQLVKTRPFNTKHWYQLLLLLIKKLR